MSTHEKTPLELPFRQEDEIDITKKRGLAAESQFAAICANSKHHGRFPAWLSDIVKSTPEEDSAGADFFAETHEGFRIPVDVKSSLLAVSYFQEKLRRRGETRQGVVIIIVNRYCDGVRVWDELIRKVESKRQVLLGRRGDAK